MNRFANEGHKVKCIQNFFENHQMDEVAKQHLEKGKVYTVHETVVTKTQTLVYLKEIPNHAFDSRYFKDLVKQSEKQDKLHRDYWKHHQSLVKDLNKTIIQRDQAYLLNGEKLTKPYIYYVVQGRKVGKDSNFIEQYFMDENPLEARERAFAYMEYFVQLLHQGNQIKFKEKEKAVANDETIDLNKINNYSVSFPENNFSADGIAIYMVVNEPIAYMNIKDTQGSRHLIYAVQNMTIERIETIKNSLIREYGYYRFLSINTSRIEEIITLRRQLKSKTKFSSLSNSIFTILKTPFDFYFAIDKHNRNFEFLSRVEKDFKVIDLRKTTFINKLNWHAIRVHICSFFNSGSGRIYLGMFQKGKMTTCFGNLSQTKCHELIKENILPYFENFSHLISVKFVKINKVLVPIIELGGANKELCFYDIENNNNFYYRSKNGLEKINDTEKIVKYAMTKNEWRLSDISSLLDQL
jgi:hypothetical protein